MYLPSLADGVAAVVGAARPGGLVSVLTRNRASLAMRAGMSGAWPDAGAAFDARYYRNRLGIDEVRADDPDEVHAAIEAAGGRRIAWYGVRLFTDHWGDLDVPDDFADLVAAEAEAGRRDPYRGSAALTHTIATCRSGRTLLAWSCGSCTSGSSDTERDLPSWLAMPGARLRWRFQTLRRRRGRGRPGHRRRSSCWPTTGPRDRSCPSTPSTTSMPRAPSSAGPAGPWSSAPMGTPEGPASVWRDASGATIALLRVDRPDALDGAYGRPNTHAVALPAELGNDPAVERDRRPPGCEPARQQDVVARGAATERRRRTRCRHRAPPGRARSCGSGRWLPTGQISISAPSSASGVLTTRAPMVPPMSTTTPSEGRRPPWRASSFFPSRHVSGTS